MRVCRCVEKHSQVAAAETKPHHVCVCVFVFLHKIFTNLCSVFVCVCECDSGFRWVQFSQMYKQHLQPSPCANLWCFLSLLLCFLLSFFVSFAFALLDFITLSLFRQGARGERAGTTSKRSTWHAWLKLAKSTTNQQQQQQQQQLLQLQHTEWPQNMRLAGREQQHVEQTHRGGARGREEGDKK